MKRYGDAWIRVATSIADSAFRIDPKPSLYITFTHTDIAQGIG